MLKNDAWIEQQALKGMIKPFVGKKVSDGVLSYGLESFGYTFRLANKFKVYRKGCEICVDPKNLVSESYLDLTKEAIEIYPNSYVTGQSIEAFDIPPDVFGLVFGKSSYARLGIEIIVTPIEPGWRGRITVGIANHQKSPIKVYANEGIAQIVFFQGEPCLTTYNGNYQDQENIQLTRILK